MLDENAFDLGDDENDTDEELALEFDSSHDPEAVWEWDGQGWVAVGA